MTLPPRCLLFLTALALGGEADATEKPKRELGRVAVHAAHGKLPLHFELNQGQVDDEVNFLARGEGYVLYLRSDEVAVVAGANLLRMKLVGSSIDATAAGLDRLPGQSNYFIGNDSTKWRTAVPHYSKVAFLDVYPGIDLVYYGNGDHLEYDFIAEPGADPSSIAMDVEGADSMRVDNGDLVFEVASGEVRLRKPVVYQEIEGELRSVEGRYDLGKRSENRVAFSIASYDATHPLIIDPVLEYSTFLGGSISEAANGVALDPAGNMYLTGQTSSVDFPKANPLQPNFGGGSFDGFVSKISADGSTLIYSTYLGGSGAFDQGYAIAVDSEGNAYVGGETTSSNFPLVNPIQATYAGATDAYLTKLNPDGSAIVYSTYLGGTSGDKILDLTVDSTGAAYITGYTISTNFPTKNPIQPSFGGGSRDAIVAKVVPDGSALAYATFLGGSGIDEARGIATDALGNAYITGDTSSTNFPTMNPLQSAAAGFSELFVTKINAEGSALTYSTYLGGSGVDESFGLKIIAVDVTGSAYVTAATGSTNFPLKNPLQSEFRGVRDLVLSKISADGSQLVFSTYLGGTGSEDAFGIALDRMGNAYVTGRTQSTDFPTLNAFQPNHGGSSGDGFVTAVTADGSAFLYSSYLGGSGEDRGNDMAIDLAGNVHVTGQTYSSNFPTVNALQPVHAGSADAYVTKIGTVLAPAQVTNLGWSAGTTELQWSTAPGAITYHVYRGEGEDLPRLLDESLDSCPRLSVVDLSSGPVLTEVPDANELYWYLVRAENANGLGPAGDATAGPRVHDSSGGCP